MDLNQKYRLELHRSLVFIGEMTLGEFVENFGPGGYGVLKVTECGDVDTSDFDESGDLADLVDDIEELERVAAEDYLTDFANLKAEALDAAGRTADEAARDAKRAETKARRAEGRAQRAANRAAANAE
jgi:hypothetical protein